VATSPLEQRLSTTGLSVALAAIAVAVFGLFATVTQSGSMPTVATIVAYGVPALLLLIAMAAWHIVVRVTDSEAGRGLDVVYGFGLVHQRFAAGDIESARAVSLSFVEMGGWGYRGSLRLLKYAALATRRGDALELHLRGGRRFVVTVNNPQAFVDALGGN